MNLFSSLTRSKFEGVKGIYGGSVFHHINLSNFALEGSRATFFDDEEMAGGCGGSGFGRVASLVDVDMLSWWLGKIFANDGILSCVLTMVRVCYGCQWQDYWRMTCLGFDMASRGKFKYEKRMTSMVVCGGMADSGVGLWWRSWQLCGFAIVEIEYEKRNNIGLFGGGVTNSGLVERVVGDWL
ncbi:unnamed protein product [Dovyalis caffra]|uniref:NADH dehydrogenase subunit 6 n=1 Tax=Dovyalis caffra TaxID=77055 RepID=A0AAV1S8K5_9ROSI|nr:unnamed protein product [Dovyalis caffra]